MEAEDSPENSADKDEDEVPPVAESFSDVQLEDAPILLLVYFHKALRAELAELRILAATALEQGCHDHELILDLQRRFESLKLAYKYHCAAEDEVIFLALDVHIKNVVCTYSLEHKSIDELFDSVSDRLNVLLEGSENMSKTFQELVFCIGTIRTFICQHMLKEEEQVFPLLKQQFSSREQAALVYQFLSSIPVMLLEVFLPWMFSYLSQDEKVDVRHCIKEIVPDETSLQEVLISWLDNNSHPNFWVFVSNGNGAQHQCENMKNIPKLLQSNWCSGENQHQKKVCGLHGNVGQSPLNGLLIWQRTLRKDLEGLLDNLFQMKSSNVFSDLHSEVVQLKFLVDVLIFYSAALEKFYYPALNELPSGCPAPPKEQFCVETLRQLLYHYFQNGMPVCKFVEKLLWELESLLMDVRKRFAFQETEASPIDGQNCSLQMQQQLLFRTLYIMPLGLLKCVIIWFSAYLSEDESRSILHGINQGDPLVNKSFAHLVHEWFRIGYSGKTSVENFRMNLQKMFKTRCTLSEQINEAVKSSSSHLEIQSCKRTTQRSKEQISTNRDSRFYSHSTSSKSYNSKKYKTSYLGGTSLLTSFPQKMRTFHTFPKFSVEKSFTNSLFDEPIPMDLIFFFHKAIKKDLDYLVFGSSQLAENALFLVDFHRRFHLIQFLYQIHSDAEDEIAFPALEAKGKLQNISHSYSIDHRLEGQHFKKISNILIEMLELQASVSSIESNEQDMLKYHQLCIRLQDICKSMHKVLSEHIHREETELWPLFRECFSSMEQEKIIKSMLGRIRAETLQDLIPWLIAALTPQEQNTMMSLWCSATKNTMFEEWLGEWWEGYDITKVEVESSIAPSFTTDPLEIISTYLSKVLDEPRGEPFHNKGSNSMQNNCNEHDIGSLEKNNADFKEQILNEEQSNYECSGCIKHYSEGEKKRCNEVIDVMDCIDKTGQNFPASQKSGNHKNLEAVSQENLEAAIRRVSRDSSLDPQKKSYIIQNLLMSRWITGQHMTHSKVTISSNGEEIPGQHPSYLDPLKQIFGCNHYKRNCKLVAPCCNQLYTCIRCHDEVADHSLDRKSIAKMMCMKCLIIQSVGSTCASASCKNLSMARYYCRICKLFDDDREIYHCPYCNLCRVGKGLGIDYFHCMNCNACMSRSLSVHVCREKSFMDNCPICHEDLFSSNNPVKALPCGHIMHSACFQDYTCTHYTCPICCKSLGDMQVYFRMLDALLAEEKIPSEYAGQTQVILCNDCEKKGPAPFHWLYHKCSYCGSYNTRLL